jgi:hypothetical protein
MAKEMAMQTHKTANSGKIMDIIAAAHNTGSITNAEAGQLVKDHLQQQIDGGSSKSAQSEAQEKAAASPYTSLVASAEGKDRDITATREGGNYREPVTISGPTSSSRVLAEASRVPHIQQGGAGLLGNRRGDADRLERGPDRHHPRGGRDRCRTEVPTDLGGE